MFRFSVVLSLLFVCVLLTPAQPLEAANYKVTPRVIDRKVEVRDMFSEVIKIENFASHKITVYPTVNEVSTNADGDLNEFVTASMADMSTSITSWITISRAGIELGPGEVREIPISFKINQDAAPGQYQALIGFGSGRNRDVATVQVQNGQAPAVVVTIDVGAERSEFLKLDKFSVSRVVVDKENSAITYSLTNPGETPVAPQGEVIIYNSRGEEVGAVAVNPNKDVLAPGQETEYSATVPTDGLIGKYKAFLTVDYGSAQLASVYDTTFFYIFPWRTLAIIFTMLMVLAVMVALYMRRRLVHHMQVTTDVTHLPLHVFEGRSDDHEHDLNLKNK